MTPYDEENQETPMAERPKRTAKQAVVIRTERLTPRMVRVILGGADVAGLGALPFTDHYIKILFTVPGADAPVTRTYTIRSFDPVAGEMAVDFVVHGDEGLAGPWAAAAEPGMTLAFFGPGGSYAPDPTAAVHVLVGDEAALPAIAAALERLPTDAHAQVYLEVGDAEDRQPLRTGPRTEVVWVTRGSRPYGQALATTFRAAPFPTGEVDVFVHGNAEMVRDLRRYLFVEQRVDRARVSISGYWRTGQTEDRWQSSKRDFTEQMETEEQLALVGVDSSSSRVPT